MSFPTYINFQVNNTGGGRSNMDVHSNAVKLISRKFWDFFHNSPDVLMTLSMCFTRHEVVLLD